MPRSTGQLSLALEELVKMLAAIDRFMCKALPIPGNQKGQLGFIGWASLMPLAIVSVFAPVVLPWMLVVLAISVLLFAPYFLMFFVIAFFPLILLVITDWQEFWFEEYLDYSVFTVAFVVAAVAFMGWSFPRLEVIKNYENNKMKDTQQENRENDEENRNRSRWI